MTTAALEMVKHAARAGWARPPRPSVSEWAAANRVLSARSGARPGRWDNATAPYLTAVMDYVSDPAVREITCIKGEQLGWTELLINVFGWIVDVEPGPLLWVFPTLDVGMKFNRERLMPFVRSCPAILRHLTDRRQDLTGLELRFDRMTVRFAGSNSEANLESFAYKYVFIDEFDRCKAGIYDVVCGRVATFRDHKIINGGTPELEDGGIHERFSHGTMEEFCVPCPECGLMSPRTWPNVKWIGGLSANPEEVLRSAYYRCERCQQEVFHTRNGWQLQRGKWIQKATERRSDEATKGEGEYGNQRPYAEGAEVAEGRGVEAVKSEDGARATESQDADGRHPSSPPSPTLPPSHSATLPLSPAHRSVWMRGLLSPFMPNPYGRVACEFVRHGGKITREWVNRRLGEPWSARARRLEHHELMELAPAVERGGYRLGELPPEELMGGSGGVRLLTAFCDVQQDCLYVEVVGLGPLRISGTATEQVMALVDAVELPRQRGDGLRSLHAYLQHRFTRCNRGTGEIVAEKGIDLALVDSSYFTDEVYGFCRHKADGRWSDVSGKSAPRVFPSKGVMPKTPNPRPWWWSNPEVDSQNKALASGVHLLIINTDVLKTRVYDEISQSLTFVRSGIGQQTSGRASIVFAEDTPGWYYKQLTSEQRVLETLKGRSKWVWKPRGDRENHILDCRVGNSALASLARRSPDLVELMRHVQDTGISVAGVPQTAHAGGQSAADRRGTTGHAVADRGGALRVRAETNGIESRADQAADGAGSREGTAGRAFAAAQGYEKAATEGLISGIRERFAENR